MRLPSKPAKRSNCLARRFRLPEPLPIRSHGGVGRRPFAPERDDLGTILRGRSFSADDKPRKWLPALPASQLPGIEQDPNGSIANLTRGNGPEVGS